jgi:hypothetical protein
MVTPTFAKTRLLIKSERYRDGIYVGMIRTQGRSIERCIRRAPTSVLSYPNEYIIASVEVFDYRFLTTTSLFKRQLFNPSHFQKWRMETGHSFQSSIIRVL